MKQDSLWLIVYHLSKSLAYVLFAGLLVLYLWPAKPGEFMLPVWLSVLLIIIAILLLVTSRIARAFIKTGKPKNLILSILDKLISLVRELKKPKRRGR